MVDMSGLKKAAPAKGEPPKRGQGENVIKADTRKPAGKPPAVKKKPLQVMLSEEMLEAYHARAAQDFGFKHGAKTELFKAMWEVYTAKS